MGLSGETNTSFYQYCKEYVKVHKHVMEVICETICDSIKLKRIYNFLGYDCFLASKENGYAGGVIAMWKKNCMIMILLKFFIVCIASTFRKW